MTGGAFTITAAELMILLGRPLTHEEQGFVRNRVKAAAAARRKAAKSSFAFSRQPERFERRALHFLILIEQGRTIDRTTGIISEPSDREVDETVRRRAEELGQTVAGSFYSALKAATEDRADARE